MKGKYTWSGPLMICTPPARGYLPAGRDFTGEVEATSGLDAATRAIFACRSCGGGMVPESKLRLVAPDGTEFGISRVPDHLMTDEEKRPYSPKPDETVIFVQ